MVCASSNRPELAAHARVVPPGFPISTRHHSFQSHFFKTEGGDIGRPAPSRADVVAIVDDIRDGLRRAVTSGRLPRLTLTGFVARLLSTPFFRSVGYTNRLFRQALFTQILESSIAPTRRTLNSLDQPLEVTVQGDRIEWNNSVAVSEHVRVVSGRTRRP